MLHLCIHKYLVIRFWIFFLSWFESFTTKNKKKKKISMVVCFNHDQLAIKFKQHSCIHNTIIASVICALQLSWATNFSQLNVCLSVCLLLRWCAYKRCSLMYSKSNTYIFSFLGLIKTTHRGHYYTINVFDGNPLDIVFVFD